MTTALSPLHAVARADRRDALMVQRSTMVEYLRLRVELEDWHAVRDACVDIEMIDARLEELGR